MNEDLERLLARTLQPTADGRAAERELLALDSQPQVGRMLLALVANTSRAGEIRMAAAVSVKNFVKRAWSSDTDGESPEKALFRAAALEAMFATTGNLQKQLSNTVFLVASVDFPARWPELIPGLVAHLGDENLDRLLATLSTMDQLFRKYRHETKSNELWVTLKHILDNVAAPLTELFKKMVQVAPSANQTLQPEMAGKWLDVLLLTAKVYHSLISQDLPEYFEDHLKEWMEGFVVLLGLAITSQESLSGEATSEDKLKAAILETVTLYAQRYEEEIMPFMEKLVSEAWALLCKTNHETRYDIVVSSALLFLSAICQRSQYEQMFAAEGVLRTLAEGVCVKNLELRAEDMEMFEEEPIEYMKKDLEGTDVGTRRRGAIDFVRGLCRRFEPQLVAILSGVVTSYLASSEWTKKDVVMCLVTAMASRTETARSGATSTSQLINVADFYSQHVRPLLITDDPSAQPILKTDGLKYVVTFRNQLAPQHLVEVVATAPRLLTANLPIIHKYVAYALDKVLPVKNNQAAVFTPANVPVTELLSSLLSAFKSDPKAQNSAYLARAITRVLAFLTPPTAKETSEVLATQLSEMVAAAVKVPADPVHTHFVFEALCVLVKKSSPVGGVDAQLLPLISSIIQEDVADLIPYALQLTGVMLDECASRVAQGGGGDAAAAPYISFLPFLLKEELWARASNVPAALIVIESFLRVAPAALLKEYGNTVLERTAKLILSKSLDQHGFQLANAVLPVIEQSGVANPEAAYLNLMFRRVQFSKTPKFMRLFMVFIARFVIVRGATAFYKAVEGIQPGMFKMLVEKVVNAELPGLGNMTTYEEKRLCAIGYGNLLAETATALGELSGGLVHGVVAVVESAGGAPQSTQPDEEDAALALYNAEGEFSNPYCRLSHAQHSDTLLPDIKDFKKYLAVAIAQRAATANPAVPGFLSDQVKAVLQSYMNS